MSVCHAFHYIRQSNYIIMMSYQPSLDASVYLIVLHENSYKPLKLIFRNCRTFWPCLFVDWTSRVNIAACSCQEWWEGPSQPELFSFSQKRKRWETDLRDRPERQTRQSHGSPSPETDDGPSSYSAGNRQNIKALSFDCYEKLEEHNKSWMDPPQTLTWKHSLKYL